MENLFGEIEILERRLASVEREFRKLIELLEGCRSNREDLERALRLIIALEREIIVLVSPPKATQLVITLGTPVSQ